jgi:hypothetical protein
MRNAIVPVNSRWAKLVERCQRDVKWFVDDALAEKRLPAPTGAEGVAIAALGRLVGGVMARNAELEARVQALESSSIWRRLFGRKTTP